MSKTNSGLIEYCKKQLNRPYWWGTFGQISSASLFTAKKRQYPSYYTASDFKSQFGKRVHDCIGLIKGYLWSDTPESVPKYNASQDKSASGMYKASTVKGKIGTFDYVPGRLVYKGKTIDGINHVGVYIGSGWVIEAKGHAYGVVKTAFKPAEWTYWSQCPYITADTKASENTSGTEAEKTETAKPETEKILAVTWNGIDISDVQLKGGMDLEEFIDAHPEVDFYIIKCSRAASSVNTSYKKWAKILHDRKIPFGIYHFLNNDLRKVGAEKEAAYFLEQVEPYIGEAVLACDYEDKYGSQAGTAYLKTWLDYVYKKTGVRPLVYVQQSWCRQMTEIQKAGYPLWVAKYGKNYEITKFNTAATIPSAEIAPYDRAVILQYGSHMRMAKYSGYIDVNIFYGNAEDWKALAKGTFSASGSSAGSSTGTAQADTYKAKPAETAKLSATSSRTFAISGSGTPSKTCAKTGTVTASSLNVRTWAGVQNKKCSFSPLKKGTKVEICDAIRAASGETWYYIRHNGKYGFVSAQYVKEA